VSASPDAGVLGALDSFAQAFKKSKMATKQSSRP